MIVEASMRCGRRLA